MELIACPPGHSRVVATPHPVTCEGQRNFAAELQDGERLGAFLRRTVPDWTGDAWEVRINGEIVPYEVMERVRPKAGTLIEVRGVVRKQALYIVAMAALTYFTFGVGAAAGGWAGVAATVGGVGGAMLATAIYVGGSLLINKVLGPKPATASQAEQNPVYSLGASRNQMRQYQPLPLVFGRVRFAPDVISAPYSWYEGDDQYVGMVLTPGLNVHRVEELYLGDSLLSGFDGVQVYYSGFPGMPEQKIPLYSDADTIQGGTLSNDRTWVQRTTPARTVRVQINLEYILGDQDSKGRDKGNPETVVAQYRPVGSTNWLPLITRNFFNHTYDPKRATLARDLPEGQYDIRVQRLGLAIEHSRGKAQFDWTTMTAVQADTTDYAGIPRIGIRMKATGQLQGAPDEIRCVAVSAPVPVWNGTEWVTKETSNPAAHILHYARGIKGGTPHRLAGIGLDEDMIDVASLQAFCLHCAAEDLGYDFVIKDARNHDEMVNSLAAAGFGQITWAKGRLAAIWAADEQPEDGVVNMATIKKGEFQVDYTLASAADGVEVTYFDTDAWETRTLRIPAPGVTTMLNPAQVTLEGVGKEAHAAMLGRWHLAQSLYQYKDISYATDIEHLSYGRMSNLRISHDLTQWGFSGRLRGASIVGGVVTIELDEPVRAPATGRAYIGLRVPGERNYRTFEVRPFEGTSRTLRLVAPWPADAPLPDDVAENPAHDTVWCYDYKATPGYRVRVVAIEPESDLKGARVAVVPESPEFWQYVRTGIYIPAPNESLLETRPIASGLRVTERKVVQGDTVFTELVATFDITGPVGDVVVQMSDDNGELHEVARTTTRAAAWRIPRAGTYQVVVRPFAPDGRPGIAAATIYSTIGADAPPVLVDLFDVQERSGGVRLYTWGWLADTTQSADFAGVEIRYIEGSVEAPDWDAMTPVGEDGYHTAPFEAVIPESGEWTFAARSRNTSGTLSTGMRVLTKTLGANLGEQIGGLDENIQQLVERQAGVDKAIYDNTQAALANASAIAAEAAARAQAIADEALARGQALLDESMARADGDAALADAVLQEAANRGTAINNLTTVMQSADEALAQEIAQVSAGTGEQFDPVRIWYFDADLESWTGNGTPTIVDGWLRPANHATNPYVQSPDNLGIDGSAYRFTKLRIRRVGNPTWRGAVQWTTTTDNTFNTAKQATIPEPTFDANGVATIDFRDVAWWPATVRRLRLLLSTVQNATSYFLIDWVAIGRPTPGAGVAALQDERAARIAADSAEATQRNTLATQLRGTYEGTDVAGVASGLMHSERTARAAADSANANALSAEVTARETLQAQVNHATTGLPATRARLLTEEQTRADGDSANAARSAALESTVNSPTTGLAATRARLATEEQTRADADSAFASRAAALESTVNSSTTGLPATRARLIAEEQARANADSALSQRVGVTEAAMPLDGGRAASEASVSAVEQASVTRDQANATATQLVQAQLNANLPLINPSFESGLDGWDVSNPAAVSVTSTFAVSGKQSLRIAGTTAGGNAGVTNAARIPASAGDKFLFGASVRPSGSAPGDGATFNFILRAYAADGSYLRIYEGASFSHSAFVWRYFESDRVIPASASDVAYVTAQLVTRDHTSGSWIFDDVDLRRVSKAEVAMAAVVAQHTAEIATQGGLIASQAQTLTAVQATADNASSSVTVLMEATASSSAAPDVRNASFETDKGWSSSPGGSDNTLPALANYTVETAHSGRRTLRISGSSGGNTTVYNNGRTSVREGERLRVGCWIRSSGSNPNSGTNARVNVRGYDVDGNYVPNTAANVLTVNMNNRGFAFPTDPDTGIYVVRPGVVSVSVYLDTQNHTSGSVAFDDIFIERLTQADETAMARHTVALDVNGNVSGTVNENDGTRSVFSILSNVFRVISSATAGLTWDSRNGGWFLRAYAAGIQILFGINFGQANNLCFWYGPNVGEASCTKANGTIWFDNGGGAYFKGAIIAGSIRNGGYSSSTAGAVTYTEGPFGTLGGRIAVNASYAFNQVQVSNAQGSTISPGSGTTSATLQLWRRVGNGSLQLVASTNVTGSLSITNLSDGASSATFSMSGSITYEDTAGGTQPRTFEVRMLNRSTQSLTVSGGSINSITTDQATGLTTAEG